MKVIGVDSYNLCTTGGVSKTLQAERSDNEHIPCVIVGGVWSLDEKMGKTYIHQEQANTLAQRDYKQPQAVIYETDRNDRRPSNTEG